MRDAARGALFLLAASLMGGALLFALAELPPFGGYRGAYGPVVLGSMEALRHAQQGVAVVVFDYRGFDTLGEEFILFAAVAGSLLLLRRQESEETREPVDQARDRNVEPAPAVLGLGIVMFPFTLLLGVDMVWHGHLTPGGGFQGGLLLATSFFYLYLSGEYGDLLKMSHGHLVSHLEAAGAAGFAAVGFLPLCCGYRFMGNVLPLGDRGELLSTGTIPVLNIATGIEVTCAFVLLIAAFLRQVLVIRRKKP